MKGIQKFIAKLAMPALEAMTTTGPRARRRPARAKAEAGCPAGALKPGIR
jgi:hypothetical protein